jgi:hypothetical protein
MYAHSRRPTQSPIGRSQVSVAPQNSARKRPNDNAGSDNDKARRVKKFARQVRFVRISKEDKETNNSETELAREGVESNASSQQSKGVRSHNEIDDDDKEGERSRQLRRQRREEEM